MRAFAFLLVLFTLSAHADDDVRGGLRTAALIVRDMDESLAFYRDILGYTVRVDRVVTNPVSIETVGFENVTGFRIVYMMPNAAMTSHPFAASELSMSQPLGTVIPKPADPCAAKTTRVGQVILSQQVEGLNAVAAKIAAGGYCMVSKLQLSGTGQSRTLAVLDPNGIRVEMFEYVPK
jgi:catechol 2,3-dioxygenase-like lactoylglutathione lyase family enzyme